jgi:uncharacterized protein YfaQ (DUF2300 family)
VKICFVSYYDTFLEKMEKALYVWLKHEMQKWLSVIGSAVREKTITPRGWFENCI